MNLTANEISIESNEIIKPINSNMMNIMDNFIIRIHWYLIGYSLLDTKNEKITRMAYDNIVDIAAPIIPHLGISRKLSNRLMIAAPPTMIGMYFVFFFKLIPTFI